MAMGMGMARVFGCSAVSASAAASVRVGAMPESMFTVSRRWASKKAGGSTKNGRDSESKRLGLKKSGGLTLLCLHVICRQSVVAGNIIIRQRGTKYHPGTGVGIGKDHTIFAVRDGFVRFWYNVPKKRQEVSVKNTREPLRRVAKASA
ncbi:hypothetical protein BBJ28_00008231 [Nothophytophthora sp. Chile5]|nr:hypothetical protein BBJ28_00008231 [Nothophytophthora sp. Chile5]